MKPPGRRFPQHRRSSLLLAVLAALAAFAGTSFGRPGLLAELALMKPARGVLMPLSVASAYAPCPVAAPVAERIPRADCVHASGALSPRFLRYATRAAHASRTSADPEALHAMGLISMMTARESGNAHNQSIYYLREAARLSDAPAPALADLAAAYLVRAGREQRVRDLVEAVDAAERSLKLDATSRAARYTLAAALDNLGLDAEAAAEWRAYLALDPRSGWADEARRRLSEISHPTSRPTLPPAGASAAALHAFALAAPQEAERTGLEQLLGEWGDAVLRGDDQVAEERLRQVGIVAAGLRQAGRDASLADAVQAIHRTGKDAAARTRLARAHRAYAAALRAYETNDYAVQERWSDAAIADAEGSRAFRRWARVSRAVAGAYNGQRGESERAFRALVTEVDTLRYPSLAARVRWTLSNTLQWRGDYESGLRYAREAERLYARAGHREHQGMLQLLAANAHEGMGDAHAAYAATYRALLALRPYRGSVWRHNALHRLATRAQKDGLPHAALRFAAENVDAAARTGQDEYAAEARLRRASLRWAVGDTPGVHDDLDAARRIFGGAATGHTSQFLDGFSRLVQAHSRLASEPARAAAELAPVVTAPDQPDAILLPALFLRAQALLAAGRTAEADADLHRALEVLDEQRDHVGSAFLRWSLMEASRGVVDQAVALALAQGRVEHALDDLDRARAALAPVGAGEPAARRPGVHLPAGTVAVEYSQLGDTLLAWVVADRRVHLARTHVSAAWLARTVEQARGALETRGGDGALPLLSALYDRLVRPIRPHLGTGEAPLVIVADGVLGAVPFAALRDRERGRYLVQDHVLRFAGSLREAFAASPRGAGAGGRAVLLGPHADRQEFPDLPPLPAAAQEIAALSRVYPGAQVIAGADAMRGRVEAALRGGGIVHFAGHAAFDEERPELSYLALSGTDSARMTAAEIERMQLRGAALVVLSACETVRGGRGSGALTGLSGAFLAAGARGVVGSLWRVDDGHTRTLMLAFHRSYAAGGDGARALRDAQVEMLRSAEAELRSPAAWAGFRYAGRQ